MKLAALLTALVMPVLVNRVMAQQGTSPAERELWSEALARELWFVGKAGELSDHERKQLELTALESLDSWRARLHVPYLAPALRRELTPLLKEISPLGWAKLDTQCRKLDARRRFAASYVQTAELDEALSLSAEQRESLYERLASGGVGIQWWPENRVISLLHMQWPRMNVVAAGNLGSFVVSDSELKKMLRPPQFVRYRAWLCELPQGMHSLEVTWQIAQPVMLPAEAGKRRGGGQDPPIALAGPALSENQQQWLRGYLDRLVERVGYDAGLTDVQREKLSVAGRLDIERWRAAGAPGADAFPISHIYNNPPQIAGGSSTVRAEIFDVADSFFQQVLRNRLSDEQKASLASAEDKRHSFHRRALGEAVVVGFERAAALTAAQCDELAETLSGVLVNVPSTPRWRWESLKAIAKLPKENLQPTFSEEQWPAVAQQLTRLATISR